MRVKILKSNHPDIPVGTTGTAISYDGGYEVKVNCKFAKADKLHDKVEETRIIWCSTSDVEILP